MPSSLLRHLPVCALLALAAALASPPAWAQRYERDGGQRNAVCVRLEASLASLERAPADPRTDQNRRLEETAQQQARELERAQRQAQQMGCDRGGFFIFGGPPAQCTPLNNHIQRLRSELERTRASIQQSATAPSPERDEQRRALMVALAQNDCGPQYRTAAAAREREAERPRGLFETLFGLPAEPAPPVEAAPPPDPSAGATFRTLCVRMCDGAYFPISYVTVSQRFSADEQLCRRQCPAAEVALFTHRNPGEDVAQAVSTTGQPYTSLPNAFRFRREYDPSCSCKAPNQTWAEALGQDPTVEHGDVVVTEESAKAMSRPRQEPRADQRRSAPAQHQQQNRGQQTPRAAQAGRPPAPPQQPVR